MLCPPYVDNPKPVKTGVPMIFLILMSPPVINLTLSDIKSGKTTSVLKSIAHDSSSVRCSAK